MGIVQQVLAALQQVAVAIEPTAKAAFALYVRQAYVYGVEDLIAAVLCLAIAVLLFVFVVLRWLKEAHDSADGEFATSAAVVVGLFGVIPATIAFFVFLLNGLNYALNPEFQAVQMILHSLHGGS